MPTQTLVLLVMAGACALGVIAMVGATFFSVEQRTVVVQRLGRFLRERKNP